MGSSVIRRLLFVVAILTIPAFPGVGYAQEAVLGGTVTDSTGAVLPGVTVKAVLEATGNTFETVTDSREVQELPSAGRNWIALALLSPGNRTNGQGLTPVEDRVDVRAFQLNVDGQQITSNLGTGNQARYSNDSIAEFQFISNRFDATQGRSSGVQV